MDYARMMQGEDVSDTFKLMMSDFDIPLDEMSKWTDELHQKYDGAFGREMVQNSIQGVRDSFFAHAKALGQFMALAERCQLLAICNDALKERKDGFMSMLRNAQEPLKFLNEHNDCTGQKRIVHAIHLGLLGEVGQCLQPDDFSKLFEKDTIDILANYGNDVRLKDWLSTLNEPEKTRLFTEITRAYQAAQPPNPDMDTDSSEFSGSEQEDVATNPSVAFESLYDDQTGLFLIEFERDEQCRAANVTHESRAAMSAGSKEPDEPPPSLGMF